LRKSGPYVTDAYEPRQIRKEAAVNKAVCVVPESIFAQGIQRTLTPFIA